MKVKKIHDLLGTSYATLAKWAGRATQTYHKQAWADVSLKNVDACKIKKRYQDIFQTIAL